MLILDKILAKYHFHVKIEEIFHEIQCNIYEFSWEYLLIKQVLVMWPIYGVLRFMGLQRVGHDWATELNWTDGIEKVKKQKQNPNKQKADKMQNTKINCLQVSEMPNSRLMKRAMILEEKITVMS